MARIGGRPWTGALMAGFLLVGTMIAPTLWGIAPAQATSRMAESSPAVARTDLGLVRGRVTDTQRRFSRIPFAAPPTGDRRFRAPQPAAAWPGIRDATRTSAACPQSVPAVGTLLPSQEDCLTLDVYTPAQVGTDPLPVMVWFYGGAYLVGAVGSDPTPLLRSGSVIVVEVNYRLGPFGFLSLPALGAESPSGASGNYGLMDQQAGLRWVRRNIAAFGGDPDNVTIFGESAGGNSVCQQVASPLARGLFAKAISQSGACAGTALRSVPQAEMTARSRAFATELGCADPTTAVACLRALPTATLLSSATVQFSSMALTWQPSVDGYVVPRSLDDAWRAGSVAHVPMIIGNNHDEGRLFVYLQDHLATLRKVTPDGYATFVRETFGASAPSVLARYPVSAYPSADYAKAAVITDGFFACPAAWSTARATAAGNPVWAYQLTTQDPPLQVDPYMTMGNAHAIDLLYLFDSVQQIPVISLPSSRNAAQNRLSSQLATAWTTFARTGNPGPVGGTPWPQWTPSAATVLELDSAGNRQITQLEADHQCDFWAPVSG